MTDPTRANFRACFMTGPGKMTLGQILIDAGYFDEIKDAGDMVRVNFARQILRNCGIDFAASPGSVRLYVNKLFELPFKEKDYGKEESQEQEIPPL